MSFLLLYSRSSQATIMKRSRTCFNLCSLEETETLRVSHPTVRSTSCPKLYCNDTSKRIRRIGGEDDSPVFLSQPTPSVNDERGRLGSPLLLDTPFPLDLDMEYPPFTDRFSSDNGFNRSLSSESSQNSDQNLSSLSSRSSWSESDFLSSRYRGLRMKEKSLSLSSFEDQTYLVNIVDLANEVDKLILVEPMEAP